MVRIYFPPSECGDTIKWKLAQFIRICQSVQWNLPEWLVRCKRQPIACILTDHAHVHQKLLCCSEHVLTKVLAYSVEKMAKNCLLRNRGSARGNCSHMLAFMWAVGSSRSHWALWFVAIAACPYDCPRRRSSCVYMQCIQSDTSVLQGSLGESGDCYCWNNLEFGKEGWQEQLCARLTILSCGIKHPNSKQYPTPLERWETK